MKKAENAEISKAPYIAINSLKTHLTNNDLMQLILNPQPSDNHSMIILLLGISGDDVAKNWINHQIIQAVNNKSTPDLAAIITAKIKIEKETALTQIKDDFISLVGII